MPSYDGMPRGPYLDLGGEVRAVTAESGSERDWSVLIPLLEDSEGQLLVFDADGLRSLHPAEIRQMEIHPYVIVGSDGDVTVPPRGVSVVPGARRFPIEWIGDDRVSASSSSSDASMPAMLPNVEDVEGVDKAEDSNVEETLEREGTEENHSTDAVENNLEDMDVVLSIGDLIEKAEFNRLHS